MSSVTTINSVFAPLFVVTHALDNSYHGSTSYQQPACSHLGAWFATSRNLFFSIVIYYCLKYLTCIFHYDIWFAITFNPPSNHIQYVSKWFNDVEWHTCMWRIDPISKIYTSSCIFPAQSRFPYKRLAWKKHVFTHNLTQFEQQNKGHCRPFRFPHKNYLEPF